MRSKRLKFFKTFLALSFVCLKSTYRNKFIKQNRSFCVIMKENIKQLPVYVVTADHWLSIFMFFLPQARNSVCLINPSL